MKKFKYFLAIIFTSLLITSCHDDWSFQGSPRVKFGPGSANNYSATFYVEDLTVPPTYSLDIQLVSAPLDVPVTVQINVLNHLTDARVGIDYSIPSYVTIPAGSNVAKLIVTGYFSGVSDGLQETRTLAVEVIGTDGVLSLTTPIAQGSARAVNTFVLTMRRLCQFVPEDFEGTYEVYEQSGYESSPYPRYDVDVTLLSVADGIGTFEVVGLWEEPFPIEFTIDGNDPTNMIVNIPKQAYYMHATYGQMWFQERGPGTADQCDLIINANYQIYVDAGWFDQVVWSIWTKK